MMYRESTISLVLLIAFAGCKGCGENVNNENLGDLADLQIEQCDNGEDDNDDGLVDCADVRCQVLDACVFTPPNPADIAPPAGSNSAEFADSVRFLWEGDDPVIRDVDTEVLEMDRVAVVRAQLHDTEGNPVGGVRANIGNRPEFGYTFSRGDGMIDLVSHGGELVNVRVGGGDYLTVDREVEPERLSYGFADEIVMTPISQKSSSVSLSDSGMVEGEMVEDESGSRMARIYFQPDTVATALLPDGQRGVIDNASVRLTEYTVGDTGFAAMPARLPDQSAYTYAVELTIDEARSAGANEVQFSKPVYLYLDNFLEFDVGTPVPSGFYLRTAQTWDPSPNGIVLERTSGGVAIEPGETANRSARDSIGLSNDELSVIEEMFEVGETFWRVPAEHFSPIDLNWPFEFPEDAVDPDDIPDYPTTRDDDPCLEAGSTIECQNQVMSRRVSLPGTPLDLVYRSDRVAGAGRYFSFPITSDEVPSSLDQVVVIVDLAGRTWREEFEPEPSLTYEFEWDGLDAYGREASGKWPLRVEVLHYYEIAYTSPPPEQAFAQAGGQVVADGRRTLPLRRTHRDLFGTFDALDSHGLGGWSFNRLHEYDAGREQLFPGAGPERGGTGVGRLIRVIERFGDTPNVPFDIREQVHGIVNVHVAPDDSLYIELAQVVGSKVLVRRLPSGEVQHIAGRVLSSEEIQAEGCSLGCGFDGPPTEAVFTQMEVAIAPDGTPVVGSGLCFYAIRDNSFDEIGDCDLRESDRPAGSEDLPNVYSEFVVTDEGDVVLASNNDIFRLSEDGFIERVAGCRGCENLPGWAPRSGRNVEIRPQNITQTPDGDIYFSERDGAKVMALDDNDNVRLVAPEREDSFLQSLTAGNDGRIYAHATVRGTPTRIQVLTGASWQTLAGAAADEIDFSSDDALSSFAEEGRPVPAGSTLIFPLGDIAVDSAGAIFLGTATSNPDEEAENDTITALQQIDSAFGAIAGVDNTLLPSRAGDRLFRFDVGGNHVETIDSATFATLMQFERGEDGYVTAVIDGDGNRTTIERSGVVIEAIEGPWGHRVDFQTNDDGYITSIDMPDGTSASVGLGRDGLMETWTNPAGGVSTYSYDSVGRLSRAEDPEGGFKELTRLRSGAVELTTASGRQQSFGYVDPVVGDSVTVDSNGLEWRRRSVLNGLQVETMQPDGTVTRTRRKADPRFGLLAGYTSERTTQLPSGLTHSQTIERAYESADANDITSLVRLLETRKIDDRTWTFDFDVPTRTLTKTSAEGRTSTIIYDDQMRIVSEQFGSFAPVEYEWNEEGLLSQLRQGDRVVDFRIGSDGFVEAIEWPGGARAYDHDMMGRVIGYDDGTADHTASYDAGGNMVESVVGGTYTYGQSFTAVDLPSTFTFPDGSSKAMEWDLDRRVVGATQRSGAETKIERDAGGRLLSLETPEGTHSWTYNETTGQPAEASSPDVTTALSWDGVLITERAYEVDGERFEVTRRFNDDFDVTRRTAGGASINHAYDRDGYHTEVGPVSVAHLDDSPIPETITVDGITTTYSYSDLGETRSVTHSGPSGTIFSESIITEGGIASTIEEEVLGTPATLEFDYDGASRLASVTRDGANTGSYMYDAAGARTNIDGAAVSHDADGRTTAVGTTTYEWDVNGRLAAIDDGARTTFVHDTLGQLASVTTTLGESVTYQYDVLGRRVGRTVDGALDRLWVYDETSQPEALLDGSGALVARFVYASSGVVPDAMYKDDTLYRLIRDRRHSVRLVVDASDGTVAQQLLYGPLGDVIVDTNPGFQPFGFAGGLLDEKTGLVRMGARDYDPRSGRWVTPDPRGFADHSTGLYQYAVGDPINYIDPDGEAIVFVLAAVGVVTYAGVQVLNKGSEIVSDAGREARATYWGLGGRAGPQNALRHCTGQCEFKRTFGHTAAFITAEYHEAPYNLPNAGGEANTYDNPDKGVDKLADQFANLCGRELADEQPERDCLDLCQEAIDSGRLPIPHQYHWQNDNGNLDTRVRRAMQIRNQEGRL